LLCIDVGTIVISFCFLNSYRRKEDEHREREREIEKKEENLILFSL
jgi:hypothetical protein